VVQPGDYGLFVFFLVSGHIVPASLERKGSVRTFWVSRIFRLYPLYLLAVGLALVLYAVHVGGLSGEGSDPETSVLSQMLMMSNVLAGKNLPYVVWSLSYEMIFYLLLTALFMARVHRRSSRCALAFAVAAVALGGLLPQAYFNNNLGSPGIIALVADLVVLTGLVALMGDFPVMPRPASSSRVFFTVRTYGDTRPLYGPELVRNFLHHDPQNARSASRVRSRAPNVSQVGSHNRPNPGRGKLLAGLARHSTPDLGGTRAC
jgi:peptidoglycan/LPS O-acetylase OafA/YrhL